MSGSAPVAHVAARGTFSFTCLVVAMTLLSALCTPAPVAAQDYPSGPVTLVVPIAAGGGTDLLARAVASRLSDRLGKPVVVENRPGRVAAAVAVAGARPDGQTLLIAPSGTLASAVTLFKKLPYDPENDYVPIAMTTKVGFVLVVNPSLPVKTVQDLVKLAKDQPGKLSYGSSGTGGAQHLAGELFNSLAGVKIAHIPYRGTVPALTDVIAGHVQLAFADPAASVQLIRDGKIRALGVTSLVRIASLPELPPLAESGLKGFESTSWHIIVAPSKTSSAIVNRLHAELKAILAAPDLKSQINTLGLIPMDTPPIDELRAFVKQQIAFEGKIVRDIGIAASE
jgi:tripartite-type tricarboxylate transporter receptor subunit TctC